jgi:Fic family protein
VQNWIGGSSFNPCSAAFVPPPPDLVRELLADLCDFCNDDALPAIAQAAVAHAQFETIHPFVDGNGRAGRALIQMVLRRRGLTPRVFPPVSLILATYAQDYVLRLSGTRSVGPPDAAAAHDGMNAWIALFAQSCIRSVADAGSFEERVRSVQARWRERVGRVRANSALDLLIRALPGAPVVTVNAAAEMIGRSFQATNTAIAQLAGAGVLAPITVGRRNRAFEAADIIDAFADFERQMASPQADTQIAPPVRSVPRRRPQRA